MVTRAALSPVLRPILRLCALLIAVLALALPGWAQNSADSLRLIVPAMRPMAGEMIAVTLRGEYTGAITNEDMTFPDSGDYDWIQLGPDSWSDARVDGKARRVFERQIAVFARKPGPLRIGPVTHHLTKAEAGGRVIHDITASPVQMAVTPFPAPGRPLAARSLKVTDELSGDAARIRDDQTILRRITLTAEGSMGHLLPPRPELRAPWLISFAAPERRETHLTPRGPVAFVQWDWHLRPITGEQGTLPPMRFSWFDTNKRELRGEITQPIPFGYGRVSENVGGTASAPRHMLWRALALLAAGMAVALLVVLWGRGAITRQGVAQVPARLWHRIRPNPALPALQQAAHHGDLFALRRAAQDYLDAEARAGRPRPATILQALDRALYGPDPDQGFDRAAFVQMLRRRGASAP